MKMKLKMSIVLILGSLFFVSCISAPTTENGHRSQKEIPPRLGL